MKNKLIYNTDQLKLLPQNARRHPERNIEDIKRSLQEHGQVTPIVVDKNKVVRKGNGTLIAAKELGWKDIWVVPYSEAFNANGEESEKRLRKYQLQDNRTQETSEWNLQLLKEDFEWLIKAQESLEQIGWLPIEVSEIMENIEIESNEKDITDTTISEEELEQYFVTCPECGHKFEK